MTLPSARVFFLGLLLVLVGTSCGRAGDDAHPDAGVVDASSRCEGVPCAPYACDPGDGTCFHDCRGDAQCALGFVCSGDRCMGTECTPETADTVCGPYACVDGACAPDCALGSCADGYYCRGDNQTCVPRCTAGSDPGCGGYVCDVDVGECEPYCLDGELPCAAGHVCGPGGVCHADPEAPTCATGCGAFACVTALDRCAVHCVDDGDCAAPATCRAGGCD